jgi:hypothetical protein
MLRSRKNTSSLFLNHFPFIVICSADQYLQE